MVLTKQEITNVLAFIEDEIHEVNQIDSDISSITNSNTLQLKIGFDEDDAKKEHARNIVRTIRFIMTELGVQGLPSAFSRQDLIAKGRLE